MKPCPIPGGRLWRWNQRHGLCRIVWTGGDGPVAAPEWRSLWKGGATEMDHIRIDIQTSKELPPLLLPLHDARISDFSDIGDVAKAFTRLPVEKLDFLEDVDPLRLFHAVSSLLYLT